MEHGLAHHPARLASLADAGGGMTLVTIDVSPEVAATYASAGQYVEVRARGEKGYFVLAGAPGGRPWELLMRSGGGVSDVLLVADPGLPVEITGAIGDGFPMRDARGGPLVLVVGGTGIAAARPIVNGRVADGDAARTQVYVGARVEAELALAGDLERWTASGVGVVVCIAQPDAQAGPALPAVSALPALPAPSVSQGRARGYVQDVIRAATPLGGWRGAHVFAVGAQAMVDALRALAPDLGLRPDQVLTNH